jgi:hypothetical protein
LNFEICIKKASPLFSRIFSNFTDLSVTSTFYVDIFAPHFYRLQCIFVVLHPMFAFLHGAVSALCALRRWWRRRRRRHIWGGALQNGSTALSCAGYYGHVDCVRLMLDAGADKNVQDNVRLLSFANFHFSWLYLILRLFACATTLY